MLAQKVVKIKGETILDSEEVQICEWYGIFFRNLRNDLATSRQNAWRHCGSQIGLMPGLRCVR
jgi:hypothetical protein